MMRAKLQVSKVTDNGVNNQTVEMFPVCGNKSFGAEGESEDNTYARWTPSGSLVLQISNPNLIGKFSVGQKFYADFTPTE